RISKDDEEVKVQNADKELMQEEKGDSTSKDSWRKLEERVYEVKNEIVITQKDFENAPDFSPFSLKKESEPNRKKDSPDLRIQINSLKPNTLEGSQGQLCVRINEEFRKGSGTLCCLPNSGRRFVLTCAHNFIRRSYLEREYIAESACY